MEKDGLIVKIEMCGMYGTDQHLWLGEPGANLPWPAYAMSMTTGPQWFTSAVR